MHSLVVEEGESVHSLIEKFSDQPELRGIFVIDEESRFKGVITRFDLLNWTRFKLGGGFERRALLGDSREEIIMNIIKYTHSTTANDLIRTDSHNAYVKPEDDIILALNLMLSLDLITVPVLDEKGKIIGDLKLTEILNKIIKSPQK